MVEVVGMKRRQLAWQRGQQATDEIGGNHLGGAAEEGLGKELEVFGVYGGDGNGFVRKYRALLTGS